MLLSKKIESDGKFIFNEQAEIDRNTKDSATLEEEYDDLLWEMEEESPRGIELFGLISENRKT